MKVMLKFSDRYRFGKYVWIFINRSGSFNCYSNKYNIISSDIYQNQWLSLTGYHISKVNI